MIRVLFANESQAVLNTFKEYVDELGWVGYYVPDAVGMMDCINELLQCEIELDAIVANVEYLSGSGSNLTGITAGREARKAMPNVPIVFTSAYVTSMIREEVRRLDAEIMANPLDPSLLFTRLTQLIQWHRVVTLDSYEGPNRRRASVNRTIHFRRASDYVLATPERLSQSYTGSSKE